MTKPRDPDDAIRAWFAEPPERAPERAVNDTIERLRVTQQSRALTISLPFPLAAALALTLVLVATLSLLPGLSARPPGPSPSVPTTPAPSATPACSLQIAASGRNGTVFVGTGFGPDTDVVLEVDRADGAHVTIRPIDLPGLHTDDQGRFGVTLYGSAPDVGTDTATATAGCTASVSVVTSASQVPPSCPSDDASASRFRDTDAYRAAVTADRPIHWWHLDEGLTDSYADAIGQADGTRIGLLAPVPATGHAHAALFDGAGSYVQLPAIRLAGSFTVEAWVYLCGLISNEDAIVGHGQAQPNINFFEGHLRLFVGDAGDLVVATTPATAGQWEHWAIERTPTGTRIFRNGVLDAVGASWSDLAVFDEIGRGDVGYFHGLLDEVAIYDRALTAAQITAHVAAAPPP